MNLGIIVLIVILAIIYFAIGLKLTYEYKVAEKTTTLQNRLLLFLFWIVVLPIWFINVIVIQDK